ncbi:hypothetical protein DAI22_12g052501 [Oryza sativa Japonica Group]|nr:hypothetical protein DAI22_12g052501 [Oryza sativa Japonica Group]
MPLPRQWEAAGRTDATAAPGDRAWSWDALPYGCIHNSLMPSPPLLLAIEEVMMSLLADDGLVLCLGAVSHRRRRRRHGGRRGRCPTTNTIWCLCRIRYARESCGFRFLSRNWNTVIGCSCGFFISTLPMVYGSHFHVRTDFFQD